MLPVRARVERRRETAPRWIGVRCHGLPIPGSDLSREATRRRSSVSHRMPASNCNSPSRLFASEG